MKNSRADLARARAFIAKIPFNAFLGLEFLRAHPDGITLRCKIRQELLLAHAWLLRVGSKLCVGRVDLADNKGSLVGTAIVTCIFLDARGSNAKGR